MTGTSPALPCDIAGEIEIQTNRSDFPSDHIAGQVCGSANIDGKLYDIVVESALGSSVILKITTEDGIFQLVGLHAFGNKMTLTQIGDSTETRHLLGIGIDWESRYNGRAISSDPVLPAYIPTGEIGGNSRLDVLTDDAAGAGIEVGSTFGSITIEYKGNQQTIELIAHRASDNIQQRIQLDDGDYIDVIGLRNSGEHMYFYTMNEHILVQSIDLQWD